MLNITVTKEKCEDIKWVIISRIFKKDTKCNGQKKQEMCASQNTSVYINYQTV